MIKLPMILGATALAAMLSACGPSFVTYNELSPLYKGMARKDVKKLMPIDPDGSHLLSVDGNTYELEYYPLQTAQATSTSSYYGRPMGMPGGMFSSHTASKTSMPGPSPQITTVHNFTLSVYFLYIDDKLRYWGTMGDYSKSEDLEMAELAPHMYTIVNPDTKD